MIAPVIFGNPISQYRRLWRKRLIFTFLLYSDKNECESDPCENGGHCLDVVNGYYCECQQGYRGQNCEHSKYLHRQKYSCAKCQLSVRIAAKHNRNFLAPDIHCRCKIKSNSLTLLHSRIGWPNILHFRANVADSRDADNNWQKRRDLRARIRVSPCHGQLHQTTVLHW